MVMRVWLGARLDCRFRTGIWKRATESRAISFDVPVSFHSPTEALLSRVVYFLQKGSAEISAFLFGLTPLPVLREGFVFHLPRFSIEVARECSGIRSSIALLVLAILVGHFFLRTWWRQALFVLAGFVVMIVKNGIRIVTLTVLASYVDPGFLYGNLHREGGVVFFLIGLLLMVPVFWLLQTEEHEPNLPAAKIAAPVAEN